MKISITTLLSVLLCSFIASAQLSISFPVNRAVIQRNQNNVGVIQITGGINQQVDAIMARLTPINGQGRDDNTWHTLSNQSSKGTYRGNVTVVGGWYRLEVAALKGGQTVASSVVERVGVGEVFIVAGQSNAQGFQGFGSRGATDDRVNCVNFYNSNSSTTPPNDLVFSHLGNGANIAPRGQGPWCWGELGDKLAARLGVPILFFNAAWTGSLSFNWRESALQQRTWDTNFQVYFPYKFPYENLRLSLNYYGSLLGVRAVLWHQGEGDVSPGIPSFSEYVYNLTTVIDHSRADFGNKVPWVISKVSYNNGQTSTLITSAQQEIINRGVNYQTFEGPSTDNLMIPRYDEVHFGNNARTQGLTTLAEAWNSRIDNFFLSNATPILSKPILDLSVNCDANNNIKLQIPGGYSALRWNNGSVANEQTLSVGTHFATVADGQGNYYFTNAVNIEGVDKRTDNPVATASASSFCEGESTTLVGNGNFSSINWNTGQVGKYVTVTNGGGYSFVGLNDIGCHSGSSNTVNVIRNASPAAPVASISGNATVCDGESVAITVNNESLKTIWNDGNTSTKRTFTALGEYHYSAKYQGANGCFSQNSNTLSFSINSIPPKPIINASNITPACVGTPVDLSVDNQFGVLWSDNNTSQNRSFNTVGAYAFTVKNVSSANCISPVSDELKFVINPTPAAPAINFLTAAKVCYGDSIRLQIKPDYAIRWDDNFTESKRSIGKVGNYNYTARYLNQFGCLSAKSNNASFVINPIPPQPKIIAETPTTVCDGNVVRLRIDDQGYKLRWSDSETAYSRTLSAILNKKYTAQFENEFGCFSLYADSVRVIVSENPTKPQLTLLSELNVCSADTIKIKATAQEGVSVIWHDVVEGRERGFTVGQSHNYFARAENKYRCSSAVTDTLVGKFYKNPDMPEIQQTGIYELNVEAKDSVAINWFKDTKLISNLPFLKIKEQGQYEAAYLKTYKVGSKTLTCKSSNNAKIAIDLSDKDETFWVYPNPSDGNFYIESTLDDEPSAVHLFDATGKIIYSSSDLDFKRRKSFDFSELQAGGYWIYYKNGAYDSSKKIVIVR